jgi:hypothetical protein
MREPVNPGLVEVKGCAADQPPELHSFLASLLGLDELSHRCVVQLRPLPISDTVKRMKGKVV